MLAIIQSGRLSEPVSVLIKVDLHSDLCPSHAPSQEHILSVLKCLNGCSKKKSYLKEFCAVAVCQLVDVCPPDALREDVVPSLPGLTGGWEGCTPETLLLLLHLSQQHAKVCTTPLPPPPPLPASIPLLHFLL